MAISVPSHEKHIPPNELVAIRAEDRLEIIDGEIVPMPPVGLLHHLIAENIHFALKTHVVQHKVGLVIMDGLMYVIESDAQGIRSALVPDISFIAKADMPAEWDIERPVPGTPTLAVEVMSPSDDPEEAITKARRYLEAGTREVWIVYPRNKEVHLYRRDEPETVHVFRGEDTVDAEVLFPDLSLTVSEIFELPALDE